jgi:hypothetical protein
MPGRGLIGSMEAVTVERARSDIRQIAMEDLIGVFGHFDTTQFALALFVEQADFHLGGVGRKQRKVGAVAVLVRAQGIRQTLFD